LLSVHSALLISFKIVSSIIFGVLNGLMNLSAWTTGSVSSYGLNVEAHLIRNSVAFGAALLGLIDFGILAGTCWRQFRGAGLDGDVSGE
jgi:hypothetical protein